VVTVISQHDNCYCVQSENNIKFGVNASFLSTDKINKEIKKEDEKITRTKKR
jgi:hypothetical protein